MEIVDLSEILTAETPVAERHSGFHTDLTGITFEEVTKDDGTTADASWVHALSIGEFRHPFWGKISLTAARMKRFAANLNNRVRGIDIAIDYDHNAFGEAAGWVQKAEARDNGLWLFVEWTKTAADKIRNREYRYFSSEFVDEYEDEQGQTYKDVILGGGLTNRPFLKNLLPVNLSELYGNPQRKENKLELSEQLRQALGLSEEATEADALEAIRKLSDNPDKKDNLPPGLPVELSDHPVVKGLIDQISELTAAQALSEARALTERWTRHEKDRKFALPPAVTEDLQKVLLGVPTQLSETVTNVIDHILEHGLVKFGESGKAVSQSTDLTTDDERSEVVTQFMEIVDKLQKDNPEMVFADAYAEAARLNENLFKEYRKATIAGVIDRTSDAEEDN